MRTVVETSSSSASTVTLCGMVMSAPAIFSSVKTERSSAAKWTG